MKLSSVCSIAMRTSDPDGNLYSDKTHGFDEDILKNLTLVTLPVETLYTLPYLTFLP